MPRPTIHIIIFSDVVCPWCYIGKRRLEKAMHELGDRFEFTVRYLPFELNPTLPQQGVDQRAYLVEKFGGEERYALLTDRVAGIGREEGLHFAYDKQRVSPNTRDAHRLIHIAADGPYQAGLVDRLFKAYFEDGVDLSRRENLLTIAAEAGLSRPAMEEYLSSDAGNTEVALAEREAHQKGIHGVPFYILNNAYGVSGAQSTATFVRALLAAGNAS